jgi:hypothetical protein
MQHLRAPFRGLFARVDWGLRIAWYIDERMGHLLFPGFRNCIRYSGLLRVFRDSVLCLDGTVHGSSTDHRRPFYQPAEFRKEKKRSPSLSR